MLERLEEIKKQGLEKINSAKSSKELEEIRRELLGKKSPLTEVLKTLGSLDVETKKQVGMKANEIKNRFDEKLNEKDKDLVDNARVTDEEVDAEVERQRENNARSITIEDRPVADGDTTVIDFEGFVDGEAFEGGKGENYPLVIGSHSFIDTFEDQLIGKNSGEEVEVNVTFPEEYQAEDLAGKPAVFKVKINEIKGKELPELDDDFAQDISEFDTLAEYKEDVKKKLQEQKEAAAKRDKEDEAIRKIIDKSKMELPEPMIEMQVQNIINDFATRISQQGLSMEQYMQFSGATIDSLKEQVRPDAIERIQSSLVLEEIAKAENIEVSDEELDKEFERLATAYRTDVESLKEYAAESEIQAIKDDLALQKAADLIMENVKERAKPKKKAKEEDKDTDKEEK